MKLTANQNRLLRHRLFQACNFYLDRHGLPACNCSNSPTLPATRRILTDMGLADNVIQELVRQFMRTCACDCDVLMMLDLQAEDSIIVQMVEEQKRDYGPLDYETAQVFLNRLAGPEGLAFRYVQGGEPVWNCPGDASRPLTRKILASMGVDDWQIREFMKFLDERGIGCDCEVTLNL